MILFDLLCTKDHAFEAWFHSGSIFDEEVAAGQVACPVCGDTQVRKAPTAAALVKSGGSDIAVAASQLRQMLAEIRKQVEANADYVGERFPEEARRIHYGETESRPIYGEASREEAAALRDEGVEIVPIPWPARQDS